MLTDTKARQAKAKAKPYKVSDRDGLYLYVSTTGAKSWRYDYRHSAKRYTLTHGQYPQLALAQARERHAAARSGLEQGKNPATLKQRGRQDAMAAAGDTFKTIAEVWFAGKSKVRSEAWAENARRWLDRDVYPYIGSRGIRDITPADVLAIMQRMAAAGSIKSAEYMRQTVSQVFDFAAANLKVDTNPARMVRGAIEMPAPMVRAPLSEKEIPVFLEAVDAYAGRLSTKLAVKLLLLTLTRKSELIEAKRDEINFDKAEWRIPAERMKMKDPHIVPLSTQALECFSDLFALDTGSDFVFPHLGRLDKPMGHSTLNKMFKEIGYGERFTPHGTRATASTILNEHGWRPDVIERQLAHTERNRVRAAYNKAEYLDERRDMLQQWANHIDALCSGANVTPIRSRKAAA